MTLEKIRAALPTHIMLTPGVHRWREGDECAFCTMDGQVYFDEIGSENIGKIVPPDDKDDPSWFGKTARRPIPSNILDNQAFWIRFDILARTSATGHGTDLELTLALYQPEYREGRLYDKWLLEQMDDV